VVLQVWLAPLPLRSC